MRKNWLVKENDYERAAESNSVQYGELLSNSERQRSPEFTRAARGATFCMIVSHLLGPYSNPG